MLFAALSLMLLSLQVFQASAEGPAKQTHVRAAAVLTEIDTLIERNHDDLQERAEASQPGDTLLLSDYPIEIPLTRDEALGIDKAGLRNLLLNRSADAMYADGTGVLRDAQGADSVGRFTAAGAVDRTLDLLRDDVHDSAAVVTYILAAICVLVAVTLAALTRGFGRIGAVGVVLFLASLPMLLAGLVARLAMQSGADGDSEYVRRELLDIGATLAEIPIRNGLAFAALGLVFVVAALVLDRLVPAGDPAGASQAPRNERATG
jgi:hypothetical protein